MAHMLNRDASIRLVADLPSGWSAWRQDKDSAWERYEERDEDDQDTER